MPHCIIEYSESLEKQIQVQQLLQTVYDGAVASGLFQPEDIKVRANVYQHWYLNAPQQHFIHVTARILSGRTLNQREMLASELLSAINALALSQSSVTVEVTEMERDSYRKALS